MDIPLIEFEGRGEALDATNKKTGKRIELKGSKLLTIDNHEAGLSLAKAGLGATMVMLTSVSKEIETGQLMQIMPEFYFGALDLQIKYRDSLPSPEAKVFFEFIRHYNENSK